MVAGPQTGSDPGGLRGELTGRLGKLSARLRESRRLRRARGEARLGGGPGSGHAVGPPAAPHASEALGGDDEEVGAGVYEELLGDVRVQKVIDQVVREQRLEQQQREVNSLSQAMFSTRQKL